MPGVLAREAFARKNVPKVASAVVAQDLGAPTIGIAFAPHGSWDLIVKTGPTATGTELILRPVQWIFTAAADVYAW